MELRTRDHLPALTALLSVVSLALVFAAALRALPTWALPRAPAPLLAAIPHVNALLSVTAIGTILLGWRAIKRGNVDRHRTLMLTTAGLFGLFLVLYLYRVALEGPTPFAGPDWVDLYVYLPVLAVHILLAIVTIPLLYYALLLAVAYPVSELPNTRHPTVGKAAASLWLISFSLGTVVYAMLYLIW
jgi:putative membrane protein